MKKLLILSICLLAKFSIAGSDIFPSMSQWLNSGKIALVCAMGATFKVPYNGLRYGLEGTYNLYKGKDENLIKQINKDIHDKEEAIIELKIAKQTANISYDAQCDAYKLSKRSLNNNKASMTLDLIKDLAKVCDNASSDVTNAKTELNNLKKQKEYENWYYMCNGLKVVSGFGITALWSYGAKLAYDYIK